MALAALTRPEVAYMVEAAALLCPISYLGHVSSLFVLKAVEIRLDEVVFFLLCNESFTHELSKKQIFNYTSQNRCCR